MAIATSVLAMLGTLPAAAPAQSPSPSPPPAEASPSPAPAPATLLQPEQYESLRALAVRLDTEVQHALQGAQQAPPGPGPTRMFLSATRQFARRIGNFRQRMEQYQAAPWDVATEVRGIERRARMVSRRLRTAKVFEHTYEDWDAVLDVLGRMQKVLRGEKVELPPAHTPRPPMPAPRPAVPPVTPGEPSPPRPSAPPLPPVPVSEPAPRPSPTPR